MDNKSMMAKAKDVADLRAAGVIDERMDAALDALVIGFEARSRSVTMAKTVTINSRGFEVDGLPFPYAVAASGLTSEWDPESGFAFVNMRDGLGRDGDPHPAVVEITELE